jgi:hypothetical protein
MDPLGHASIGLLVRPIAPKAPMWALITATAVPDILFFGFQAIGLEYQAGTTFDFSHGLQYLSPPSIPWSHGLTMCIVWSIIGTLITYFFSRDIRSSVVIGFLVFSHWLLDFIVYPIMPVFFDNSKMIGLSFMTSGNGFIVSVILEISLILSGMAVYLISRKKKTFNY